MIFKRKKGKFWEEIYMITKWKIKGRKVEERGTEIGWRINQMMFKGYAYHLEIYVAIVTIKSQCKREESKN